MLLCKEREPEQLPDDITELRQLREAELLRIHHLDRSNKELEDALEGEDDPDLREAVEDNKKTIEGKLERIREIDSWIAQITTARASLDGAGRGQRPGTCSSSDLAAREAAASSAGSGGAVTDFAGGLDL